MTRRTSVCTTVAVVSVLTAVLLAGGEPGGGDGATMLDSGSLILRHLSQGEEHRYRLLLSAGEFARVVVEQKGIDVVVQVRDQNDEEIDEFQDEIRPDGEENVDVVATKTGTYTLTIAATGIALDPGLYTIRLDSRRPATRIDRVVQESRSLRTSATRLERAARFDESRSMFEGALNLVEDALGHDNAYVATLMFDLAGNALERHDDSSAQALYYEAVLTFDRLWGLGHPYSAMARSRLALLQYRAGQSQNAEDILRPALAALERSLGA